MVRARAFEAEAANRDGPGENSLFNEHLIPRLSHRLSHKLQSPSARFTLHTPKSTLHGIAIALLVLRKTSYPSHSLISDQPTIAKPFQHDYSRALFFLWEGECGASPFTGDYLT